MAPESSANRDPEDIINNVLGFALGAKGSGGTIDPNARLSSIEQPGAPPWVQHKYQHDKLTAGWHPGKTDGRITFWRKMKGTFVEWVEIGLAGSDDAPSLNQEDDGGSSSTLGAIRDAWGALAQQTPELIRTKSPLDAGSIRDVNVMLEGAANQYESWYTAMEGQIAQLNQDENTFRGSASEAYVQRVRVAMVKVAGAKAKMDLWKTAVSDAATQAGVFGNDLTTRMNSLMTAEGGRLLNPQNYVISLFNQSTLMTSYNVSYLFGEDNWDKNRNSGQNLATNGVANASETSELLNQIGKTPTMMISFPGIPGGPWDVFIPASWPLIDAAMRKSWVDKVRKIFTEPTSVPNPFDTSKNIAVPSFATGETNLGNAFNTAAGLLVPPKIAPNPKPRKPPPIPNGLNFNPNMDIGGVNYPNYNPNFPEYNPNFPEYNPNIPDFNPNIPEYEFGGPNLGESNLEGPPLGSDGLPNYEPGAEFGLDGGNDFGDTPVLGANGVPASSFGDLSSDQINGLLNSGALDDIPLTDAQLAELAANGIPAPDGSTLGDLSPAQLGLLQNAGLLDDNELTGSQASMLDQLGMGDGTPQSLGDLTPEQLTQLSQDGLLDDIPVTPEQLAQLQQDALLGASTDGINNLGDLSQAQLEDLQQAGLLEDLPLTDEQLTALGVDPGALSTLSAANTDFVPQTFAGTDTSNLPTTLLGTNGLGTIDPGLDTNFGGDLAASQFPTAIDGLDVTSPELGSSDNGFSLGDVTKPVSHSVLGGAAGISGGSLPVSGGSAGLSGGLGGLGGGAGSALGGGDVIPQGSLGSLSVGTPGGAGGAAGATSGTGAGMPYMPPMGGMGGGGGAGQQGKTRERKTWLTEDEDVWGTDPDCAPAVIGRGDDLDVLEPVEGPTVPVNPRPVRPGRVQPGRGRA